MLQTRACQQERELPMSFSMAGGGARGPEINVTPLIDVLLTLIIVFMVVVSMDKEEGETARFRSRPKANAEHIAERTVVIEVVWTKENQVPTVKINKDDVTLGGFGSRA